ncbi:hypothetical protein KI688_001185 [Linnemannia hyalina]|uniref:Uncharacterized protein n=1 Tax=Linnemannia hyalina TaxID=64524 RepID=A0A9P8BYN7_9FUNG|nr:hypothetical protein KI688_001185 [Linnemannia hyalina]
MEQPDTPPQTGNKQLDEHNRKLHRQTKTKISDEFISSRKDREARVRQQKLEQKLEEVARRKEAERRTKAKEAAEAALTLKQESKRQVKARRKEEQMVVKGTTGEFASSAKAELMGLIAGIIATPQDQDLCIRLDNQAWVKVHSGNEWKIKADMAAKGAQLQGETAWGWTKPPRDDIKHSATMAGVILDQDTRDVFKM